MVERLKEVAERERVLFDEGGLEAIIFSAEGDMRTAINNLQATHVGAGRVTRDKVFEICDIPDIEKLRAIVGCCVIGDREGAFTLMKELSDQSFTPFDLVNNVGKVVETAQMPVDMLYDFIDQTCQLKTRVLSGVGSLLQLLAFLGKLCDIADSHRHSRKSK